jgi:hypothetical protein
LLQHDPRSAAAAGSSPLLASHAAFDARFHLLKQVCRRSRPLPPLRTEDDAKSALTTASPFYFLENAGGLNKSGAAPAAGTFPETISAVSYPSSAAGLMQPRSAATCGSPFSLPMPEFDRALFPSFAAGVPTLAPLPPLRNEDDAERFDGNLFVLLSGRTAAC